MDTKHVPHTDGWLRYKTKDGCTRWVRIDAIAVVSGQRWKQDDGTYAYWAKLIAQDGTVLANVPAPVGEVTDALGLTSPMHDVKVELRKGQVRIDPEGIVEV